MIDVYNLLQFIKNQEEKNLVKLIKKLGGKYSLIDTPLIACYVGDYPDSGIVIDVEVVHEDSIALTIEPRESSYQTQIYIEDIFPGELSFLTDCIESEIDGNS